MKKMMSVSCIGFSSLALAAGCSLAGDADRVAVERNDLGVETIEVNQFAENGNDVYELRAFSANDEELALIRRTTGTIGDLGHWLPNAGTIGTEITLSVAGWDTRLLTTEVELFKLSTVDNAAAQRFLELGAVSSALEKGNLFFDKAAPGSADEVALSAASCPQYLMLTSPLAAQCCYGNSWQGGVRSHHVNPNGSLGMRVYNSGNSGAGCKSSTGFGACSGAACYFGPSGFARPIMQVPSGGHWWYLWNNMSGGGTCQADQPLLPVTSSYWPDVNGSAATGQGCPGGASGAYQWDY